MIVFPRPALAATVLIGLLSQAGLVCAHGTAEELDAIDPHSQHGQQVAANSETRTAEVELSTGLSMLNRFGKPVDLRDDVIGNRIAVVNFVYTSCTTVCPVTSSIFSMLQARLGDRMGRDVALVTITVDPTRDNPHRMLTYAKNFNPVDGWSWLTGDKASVDAALKAFGAYTPNFEDHPAMVLIGDEKNEKWYRLYGFPTPEAIAERITELLETRPS